MATNTWALVTGASSGLGTDFARALAEKGTNLVLAARRAEPMERLATELRASLGVQVLVQPLDLSVEGAGATLKGWLDGEGIAIDTLINNAGHGLTADFLDATTAGISAMLRLNVIGLTELTHVFASDMAKRGGGNVMLIASVAAFQPCPHLAAYAASKAYVLSLGYALHEEFKAKNVVVTTLSPGVTETEFFDAAGEAPSEMMKRMMMKSRPVVDIGLAAMAAGKPAVVAGKANSVMSFTTRFVSRKQLARIAYKMSTP